MKLIIVLFSFMLFVACTNKQLREPFLKLYVIDCGSMDLSDMESLSDKGEFAGQSITLANPCFLIRHPKGDLIWDVGFADKFSDNRGGIRNGVWHTKMKAKLVTQLAQIGLSPRDVDYISLSHLHPDHSGNANLFSNSTFIINKAERAYMFSDQMMAVFDDSYSQLEQSNTILFDDEHDVFGDSSAVIYTLPGQTPDSAVLLIHLDKAGNILITGDLYIHAKGREMQTMPSFNVDKQATIESRRKFEGLAKRKNARVIIHHSKLDFDNLPKFPKFLE